MTKKYKISGNIDFIKDGFIHGWAVVTQDITTQNACDLWIDGQFITTFEAVLYREDLKAESIRAGIAGFCQAIPLVFCDDQIHELSLRISDSDIVIHTKTVTIGRFQASCRLDVKF
ncbi:hypothetical protein LBMAG43_17930 [Methylococcaceae bacterium]|nr:hypothetical protein LBMAG43_17930 [Methylococcaceae bacterium]